MTLEQVTTPNTVTLRKLVEEHGYEQMLQLLTRVVQEADIMLGGDGDVSRCAPAAGNALISNGYRGVGFIIVAIREGMKRRDKEGKGFQKINAQLLNEWTAAQEDGIVIARENEHSKAVFKNDNVGRDWMDRQQHNSEADKRKIARMSAHIEMLKANLSTEPKP